MWEESSEVPRPLRTGLTTGTCATACAVASASYLLAGERPPVVSVTLPRGETVELAVSTTDLGATAAYSSTVKDAGDDPDVTHGATVSVKLVLDTENGVRFRAGPGVGCVTLPGLLLGVGEPAINPVPRRMIEENLATVARCTGYRGGFTVTIGVEQGEALAGKTMNPRLGIHGGLSILGTTGIVRPFSCAAWIASIYQGMDVARANGITHIAASTGNSSEQVIKERYQLDSMALIEMGDFVGAVLKHLRKVPFERVSICGGFGKISKLANGHMDLNSRVSAIDFEQLRSLARRAGGSLLLGQRILTANTSIEALNMAHSEGIDMAGQLCKAAMQVARKIVPHAISLEILVINRSGDIVGRAGDF